MRIHRIIPISRVNGPGARFVVWVQGCSRNCPGCFNQLTHEKQGGRERPVDEIIKNIPLKEVEGITISGGEPFEQSEELAVLLEAAQEAGLHRLVYTGFMYEELIKMNTAPVLRSLFLTNILIDGAYEQGNKSNEPWTGSGNQRILELVDGNIKNTENFKKNNLTYAKEGEIFIDNAGNVTATGIFDSTALQKVV